MRRRLALAALLLASPAGAALFKGKPKPKPQGQAPAPSGPFDTLSAAELEQTAAVLRGSGLFGPEARFPVIDVQEPAKDELAASTRTRQAFAVVYDSTRTETSEAVVDLSAGKLVSWRLIPSAARRETAPAPVERAKGAAQLPWLGLETDGRRFKWRAWTFHLSVHPREGLVLHDVRYNGRRLLHRASLSEVVALSTRAPSGYSFLLGSRGLGPSLAPANAELPIAWPSYRIDAVFADDQGRPYDVPAAAALFERPSERGEPELVAAQRAQTYSGQLLLTWVFGGEGKLDVAAQLVPGQDPAPEQDLLSYRLDFEVDGSTNSLMEVSADPARGSPAPAQSRLALRSEREARRDASPSGARAWIVYASSEAPDASGYALAPRAGAVPLALDPSTRRLAAFSAHSLWATRYRPEEQYAAGDYPGPGGAADGLERWTRRDDPLENADIVLWPSLTVASMPPASSHAAFRLLPFPFLKR